MSYRFSWFHPDRPEKTYLTAREPGAIFTFPIETRLGIIKLYSLRSATFGLGSVLCWVDDGREKATRTDGYWDKRD